MIHRLRLMNDSTHLNPLSVIWITVLVVTIFGPEIVKGHNTSTVACPWVGLRFDLRSLLSFL